MSVLCNYVLNHIVEYIPADVSYLNGFNLSSKTMNRKLQHTVNDVYWKVLKGCPRYHHCINHNNAYLCRIYKDALMKPNKKHRRCKLCKTVGHYSSACPIEMDNTVTLWMGTDCCKSRLQICLINMVSRWSVDVHLREPRSMMGLCITKCRNEEKNDRFLERLYNMLMNVRQQPFRKLEFRNWVPKYDQFMRLIQIFTTNTILQSTSIEFSFQRATLFPKTLEQSILNMLLTIKGYIFSIKRTRCMQERRYPISKIIINQISKV